MSTMKDEHQLTPRLKRFKWMLIIAVIFIPILLLWSNRKHEMQRPLSFKISPEIFKPPVPLPYRFCPRQTVHRDQELSFVPVTGTKTLLISAHLERRMKEKEVNVIAVVKRSEEVDYRCLFCCQGMLHVYKGVRNVYSNHFGFPYGTASIMCPVPLFCDTPFQIAVTSAADYNEDEHHRVFLEVKHQEVDGHSFPYSFTVCFSTMFDFTNVLQLVQSLEMLQLLGVNRVVIYKTNCSSETQRILDYYTHKGLMEVIPWSMSRYLNVSRSHNPQLSPGDIHYFGQIPALNDCVYRYMYRSRYVALHDMDELILPQSVNSWLELLPLLEKKYGADKCYKFENNEFPIMRAPPSNQTLSLQERWKNVRGVNIFSHLYQQPKAKTQYSNFKIIVNPRAVFSASVHGLLSSQKGCEWVDRDIARMYHTRVQSELTHDKLIYDGRLLSFIDKLVPAVDTVLRDIELLSKDNMQVSIKQTERNSSSNSVTVITLSISVYLFVSATCLSMVYSSVNVYTTF